MKKLLLPLLTGIMLSTNAHSGEDLTLVCEGIHELTVTRQTTERETRTYIFEDGRLVDYQYRDYECTWIKNRIGCRDPKWSAIKYLSIDRISGVVHEGRHMTMASHLGVPALSSFTGNCKPGKQKF